MERAITARRRAADPEFEFKFGLMHQEGLAYAIEQWLQADMRGSSFSLANNCNNILAWSWAKQLCMDDWELPGHASKL